MFKVGREMVESGDVVGELGGEKVAFGGMTRFMFVGERGEKIWG